MNTMNNFKIVKPSGQKRVPVIVHVPHASPIIPEGLELDLMLTRHQLRVELSAMTDRHTEKLAKPALAAGATLFVNRFSRLVVDPERFEDDEREPAARHGLGAVYTRTHDGRPLRYPDFDDAQRRGLMDRFYHPYHQALTELVGGMLDEFGHAFIIDLHSFPARPLPFEDPDLARPSVCLGFEDTHRPEDWTEWWEDQVLSRSKTLELAHNQPFAGSFVPGRFHRRDPRVKSMMVELKRGAYMDEQTGRLRPASDVAKLLNRFFHFVCEDVQDIVHPPAEGLSRRDARRVARQHLRQESPQDNPAVWKVMHPSDFKDQNLPTPYGVDPAASLRSWIAYQSTNHRPGLICSSTIVMVDRLTGKVVYSGSAFDEG